MKVTWRYVRLGNRTFASLYGLAPLVIALSSEPVLAQVNVVTEHNDIARTGQNLNETILTPATVGGGNFGKLFSQTVSSEVNGEPLYVSQVTIPGKGVHNVAYLTTKGDTVYAFDADSNGGVSASPLWEVSLLTNSTPAGTLTAALREHGTPVIDLSSNTMYLVSSETQTATSTNIFRLHALDITTGSEKFGGPIQIQATVPGTGLQSSGGVLTFEPLDLIQRPGLLEVNGVVYVAFGSNGDIGKWHGWIFSFNSQTLQQIDVFCTSPNGSGAGIWMGGAGLAAEVYNPLKPYGRMFVATGNGTYSPASGSYAMSVLDLDLTGGQFTLEDLFTPYNETLLDGQDADIGSGGPVLLPTQTLSSGQTLNPLVEIGKSGMIYILDRDNNTDGSNNPATEFSPAGLGGYNTGGDQIVQEVQTPEYGADNWGLGVWGTEAYWNNTIYSGGSNIIVSPNSSYEGVGSPFSAYSFANGVLSTTPTSQTTEQFFFPGPSPIISAYGNTNGIVWVLKTDGYTSGNPDILLAYDATNLQNLLYSSSANLARDNPGPAVQLTLPTVANGKVYVGSSNKFSVYGLLTSPTAASPVISAPSVTFSGSENVTIADTTPDAQIYYTTDGSTPTTSSNLYDGPFSISSTVTITAIASATGYLQSPSSSETYTGSTSTANPVFSLAAGSYAGAQTLTITDSSNGAAIYYTFDGTTPTTSSPVYVGTMSIPVSETIQAFAVAPGLQPSSVVGDTYTISPNYAINFNQGFALAEGPMQFNGSTNLDDYRLQLTDGGLDQAGSAFYTTPVNVQSFTTDFNFQLSNPAGDGITFTLQNMGLSALGNYAKSIGYGGIEESAGIKFTLYNSVGAGNDATGLVLDGSTNSQPSIDLTNTGIDLHSGDAMNVHITYDGTVLNLTITDVLTLATWSDSFTVNIPNRIGSNVAYAGFTGGTGTSTSSQKLASWTYLPGPPPVPNYPVGFDSAGLTLNGNAALTGTALQLTSAGSSKDSSAYYSTPVNVDAFTTDFDFTVAPGNTKTLADGFTFAIQNAGLNAIGTNAGGLGYEGMSNSVAIKFDLHNNAGEGSDSTGAYVDGAAPTVPCIKLSSTGVVLGSGDNIHAHITYDGTTLTWTLTDTTLASQPSATNSVAINIPDTVGGNAAYIGFTGASGDGTAVQQVLDWTFSSPD